MIRWMLFLIGAMLLSCNSNKTIDSNVLNNIKRYEQSAKEITACFDSLFFAKRFNEIDTNSRTLYYSGFEEVGKGTFSSEQPLPLTRKLCSDSLTKIIFLQKDTTVFYNTFNSEESLPELQSYRHFLCFSPSDKAIHLDLSHAFKILKIKKVKPGWTYIIIEQGWD